MQKSIGGIRIEKNIQRNAKCRSTFEFLILYNPPKFHNTPSHRLKNLLEFVGAYEGGFFLPFVAADFLKGVALIRAEQEK